jgi:hypothetical protein
VGLVLLAAAIATAPLFLGGASCGHDFDFHLVSWLDAQNAWRHGLLYPHWSPSANYGAGEPRFIFYPPLTWMLGALLGFLLPWSAVPAALTFLLLAGTGLATRALGRLALDSAPATLAGCLSIFSGYALFTAYERTAYGELAGGVCIPLLLLFALREGNPQAGGWRRVLDGGTLPLAWVVAAAWLCNAPVGVMACYLLAFTALVSALAARSGKPLLRLLLATVLGLSLSAFYLIPAAWEQRWVEIRQATDDPGERIENSFLFARHADAALASHDDVLHRVSLIGAGMLAAALLGMLIGCWRKRISPLRQPWLVLALLPLAILLLQLPVSLPLWNLLPKLRFLQFPWRWLVVLEAPMALLVAAAVWPAGKARWRGWALGALCAAFGVAATAYAAHAFYQVCDEEDNVRAMLNSYQRGDGFEGTDEYAPLGADNTLAASGLPAACLVADPQARITAEMSPLDGQASVTPTDFDAKNCIAVIPRFSGSPEFLHFYGTLPRSGFLILRLRRYPAWRFALNGAPVQPLDTREDGLAVLPVPSGPVTLDAHWHSTGDVTIGRILSLLIVLLFAALFAQQRSRFTQRLT